MPSRRVLSRRHSAPGRSSEGQVWSLKGKDRLPCPVVGMVDRAGHELLGLKLAVLRQSWHRTGKGGTECRIGYAQESKMAECGEWEKGVEQVPGSRKSEYGSTGQI